MSKIASTHANTKACSPTHYDQSKIEVHCSHKKLGFANNIITTDK